MKESVILVILCVLVSYMAFATLKYRRKEKRYIEYLNGKSNKRLTIKEKISKWYKARKEIKSWRLLHYCLYGKMPSKRQAKRMLAIEKEQKLDAAFKFLGGYYSPCYGHAVMPIIAQPSKNIIDMSFEEINQ